MTLGSRRYPDLPSRSALLALAAVWGRIPSWRGVCIVCTLPWRDPSAPGRLLTWKLSLWVGPLPSEL